MHSSHVVAIFGGAVAGSEAASLLAKQGIHCAVFEQNSLSYGKIEDGLPKWHIKLRDKEEKKINDKLDHPNVDFVPCTKLGRDVSFKDIVENWGFSAILLAVGAWRDRPLPIDGIDAWIEKGLIYQNPFFKWYNHSHEKDNGIDKIDIHDETVIVGGGLASIDVVKALMCEIIGRSLAKKGHTVDMFTLEKKGPVNIAAELGFSMQDLGIKGCALYYRRNAHFMPITPIPENADERRINKAYEVRNRMLNKLQKDFYFTLEECWAPVDKIIEDDRLAGLVFQKTKIENGRVKMVPDKTIEVKTPMVISSIGSIPEPIEDVPADGSAYAVENLHTGQINGFDNVFALGNAVTGRGNIRESRLHSVAVTEHVVHEHFKIPQDGESEQADSTSAAVEKQVTGIQQKMRAQGALTESEVDDVLGRIKQRQKSVGYDCNYRSWVEKHTPVRLENM